MSFRSTIEEFFFGKPTIRTLSSPEDAVILYLKSFVNQPAMIADQLATYARIKKITNKTEREISYITLYFELEKFLTEHKPPVIKREFTKGSLREEIRKSIHVSMLPDSFRLVFLPETEQAMVLFENGLQYVIRYILHNLGPEALQDWAAKLSDKKPFGPLAITEQGIDMSQLRHSTSPVSLEEVVNSYQSIYSALFAEVKSTLGEEKAHALFSSSFKSASEKYDDELLSQFLNILPHDIAEEDRLPLLSKQELEKRVKAAVTAEKAKAEELEREKTHIEQIVAERTEELTKVQAQLESSIDSLRVGFIMLDTDRNIIRMNGSAQLLLRRNNHQHEAVDDKHEPSPLMTKWTLKHLAAEFIGSVDLLSLLEVVTKQRKPLEVRGVEFAERYLHVFLSPIVSFKQVEVIGTVILLEDITDTKLLERSKEEFFSIASHELRTPLTAIRGNASLMQDYYKEIITKEPKLAKMVDDIYQSSIRLIEIVSDFLDMSRIEQGKALFRTEELDLLPLVKEIAKELQAVLQEKQLSCLVVEPEKPLPRVLGDEERVRQVFLNLIMNAIHYTDRGGITIRFEVHKTHVEVFVTDTGRGIPKQNQTLLFRKFQQASNSILTRDTSHGTGLGLYITKLLVEGMNGKVSLERSVEMEGSTFAFTLPIATLKAALTTSDKLVSTTVANALTPAV